MKMTGFHTTRYLQFFNVQKYYSLRLRFLYINLGTRYGPLLNVCPLLCLLVTGRYAAGGRVRVTGVSRGCCGCTLNQASDMDLGIMAQSCVTNTGLQQGVG